VVVVVETDADLAGCPGCGVVAVGHSRRVQVLNDAPCFGRPVRVRWRKRIWMCPEPTCPRSTWTEDHPFAPPRGQAHLTGDFVGGGCAAARRHHGVRDRPSPGCRLGHLLGRDQERREHPDRPTGSAQGGEDDRRGQAHRAPRGAVDSDGGERPASPGRRSGWVKLAAVCPRGTPGVDGNQPRQSQGGRDYRTGRAW
jgi:hypothetical protein